MVIAIRTTVMTSESRICARNRLPIPAISYWNATRSGVEMTRSSDASGGCTFSLYPPILWGCVAVLLQEPRPSPSAQAGREI